MALPGSRLSTGTSPLATHDNEVAMRVLVPVVTDEPVEDVYDGFVLPAPASGRERPFLAVNMVASVDGAVAVHGRTAPLAGPADAIAFPRLRAAGDAILVGAGTARVEDYGPGHGTDARRQARVAAGLAPVPTLIIVSASLELDPQARVFQIRPGDPRPIVLTHERSPTAQRRALSEVADVRIHGDAAVDLDGALRQLHADGLTRILGEGGPTLNGTLVAADLIDEVFLTISPVLVSGASSRIVVGAPLADLLRLTLVELREHDGELLTRWRVERE
jgi:riboflavin-specific deaminase-like protein